MSVHSFSIASVLFPIWVRYFWLVIIMHPSVSKNFFTSLLLIIVKTWSGYKALEFEGLKCNLTLVSTLFTFCPPGPPDLLVSKVTSEVMISLLIFALLGKTYSNIQSPSMVRSLKTLVRMTFLCLIPVNCAYRDIFRNMFLTKIVVRM